MVIDVPEDHANLLRTLCRLGEYDELPPKVVDRYWDRKRLHDRLSYSITHDSLIAIADSLGYGKPSEREANPTIIDRWRKGELRHGAPVVVKWRNGERDGVLHGVKQGNLVVQMDGDSEERTFTPDKVRVAELAAA